MSSANDAKRQLIEEIRAKLIQLESMLNDEDAKEEEEAVNGTECDDCNIMRPEYKVFRCDSNHTFCSVCGHGQPSCAVCQRRLCPDLTHRTVRTSHCHTEVEFCDTCFMDRPEECAIWYS